MKRIALHEKHIELGAKMVPFAGYEMPVQYTGVKEEHIQVRERVGIFDVSHMGEFFVKGVGALDLLQYVTTNDVSKLVPGKVQYTCMPNGKGGIVDDLLIYCIAADEFMLVVNASNIDKDWDWISSHNTMGASMRNLSEDYSLLAIQGPHAAKAMQSLTSVDLEAIKFYTFEVADFAGIEYAIISATGYTGSGGFEIYCKNSEVEQIWNKVLEAGADYGIKPIGLAARDTLRLEMGYCLYGNDIDDTTSPLEAGLGWVTKFTKEFTNSANLQKQKEEGVTKRLVGIKMIEKGIPRGGYDILDLEENVIGRVTSGTMSPSLGYGVGLGYVQKGFGKAGTEVLIAVRKRRIKAEVTRPPFYKA